jgi:hypothetical protein
MLSTSSPLRRPARAAALSSATRPIDRRNLGTPGLQANAHDQILAGVLNRQPGQIEPAKGLDLFQGAHLKHHFTLIERIAQQDPAQVLPRTHHLTIDGKHQITIPDPRGLCDKARRGRNSSEPTTNKPQ